MFLELHAIQNHAVSNLNRDRTGAPKTATFGGETRARTSSQSNKRAMREMMRTLEGLPESAFGTRTRRIHEVVAKRVAEKGTRSEEEAREVAHAGLTLVDGIKADKDGTKVALFVGAREIDALAEACEAHWNALAGGKALKGKEKSEVAEAFSAALHGQATVDLALFGRFIADNTDRTIDGATYVAHTLSTHKAETEFDFFTAVDDVVTDSQGGSAMMGTQEFNSACHYRYAAVDVGQFLTNLGPDHQDLARPGLRAFIHAFVRALPSGKQNSMASQSVPAFILAVVRDDQPISLADAFVNPVRPGRNGVVRESVKALDTLFGRIGKVYGSDGIRYAAVLDLEDNDLVALKDYRANTMIELMDGTAGALFGGDREGR